MLFFAKYLKSLDGNRFNCGLEKLRSKKEKYR
jgi:hypothetical protein